MYIYIYIYDPGLQAPVADPFGLLPDLSLDLPILLPVCALNTISLFSLPRWSNKRDCLCCPGFCRGRGLLGCRLEMSHNPFKRDFKDFTNK